ncbi:MAG: phage tail sheath C-terminal domain-containing protein [Cyanobacteria bacterium P01_A01_bin.40]
MVKVDYLAPGVYVEEVKQGSRPLQGVATAVGGFVGFTEDIRGGAELFKPTVVTSWNDYLQKFARVRSDGFTDFGAYLPFSVYGWFLNGGGRCWVTSIGTQLPGSKSDATENQIATDIVSRGNRPSMRFSWKENALSESNSDGRPGEVHRAEELASPLKIRITDSFPKLDPDAEPGAEIKDTGEYFSVQVIRGIEVLEEFNHLTMKAEPEVKVADYAVTALGASEYLQVEDTSVTGGALIKRPTNGEYEISSPALVPQEDNFAEQIKGVRDERTGVRGLFEIDEVTAIACPDLMKAYEVGLIDLEQVHGVMDLMIGICEGAASGDIPNPPNRMVLLDSPPDKVKPHEVTRWLSDEFNRRSQFAAMYYPWVMARNPRNSGRPIAIPPSGHMMGVWARTDQIRGIHKAPANEVPKGVVGLAYDCNFREQELLNPVGINCIRRFPNRGIRVWGARTLADPTDLAWRYINVRRLVSYVEKSIELGTQWVVFEPNDKDLWERVKRVISNFLTDMWRSGALSGTTPDQAFYVRCDEQLNPPESVMAGRLFVEVGVAPVRPAEFVVFRVSQWNGSEEEEGAAAQLAGM